MTRINLKKMWTLSLVVYIICSTAFSYGDLRRLNTLALYFFVGVSVLNIVKIRRVRLNFAAVSMLVYLIISLCGMFYTPTPSGKVWEVMYDYITMAVLSICIVQYIQRKEDVHIIIHAYMVAGFVLALYVFSLYGNSFWLIMLNSVSESHGTVTRLGTELTNTNTISLCAAVSSIIAAYYLIYDRKSKWKNAACALIAVFCFLVAMAAASKTSLALIFVCIFAIWLYRMIGIHNFGKQVRNILAMLFTLILLLWAINTLPIFSGIARRFDILFEFFAGAKGGISERHRTYMMTKGIAIWMDHLIVGAGTASTIYFFDVYSHSNYLELLINSGIIGFTVFYSVYLYAANQYLKKAVSYRKLDKLSVLLFALFFGVTVIGLVKVYYYDRYFMLLMSTIFSAISVYNSELRSQNVVRDKRGRTVV